MKQGFRQSMAWLHTWTGLLVGWVLLLIFMAGCLFNGLWEAQPLTKGMMVILALALASPRETAKGGG